jgi:hypothetical protein
MSTADESEQTPKGWGIAAAVVALAIALAAGAHWVHTRTYCNPVNPECMATPAPAAERGH